MKAGIALDDWKLPVFRKRLSEAHYVYEDAGSPSPGVTMLHVETDDTAALAKVIIACQAECQLAGRPGRRD
ncbi:MAG: hypothetical protein WKF79_00165 [Nocardioides sp.]